MVVQSRSRLTHTAKRLEDRGWVTREQCPDDKRGVELVLTTGGLAAVARHRPGPRAERARQPRRHHDPGAVHGHRRRHGDRARPPRPRRAPSRPLTTRRQAHRATVERMGPMSSQPVPVQTDLRRPGVRRAARAGERGHPGRRQLAGARLPRRRRHAALHGERVGPVAHRRRRQALRRPHLLLGPDDPRPRPP